MRIFITATFTLFLTLGCTDADNTAGEQASSSATERDGTITVGEETWAISALRQCSIYPGGIVNIWGFAADDPELEIVIDFGGPTGARIGKDGADVKWQAERDTLELQVDGQRVTGSATFSRYNNGTKGSAEGSFEVNC